MELFPDSAGLLKSSDTIDGVSLERSSSNDEVSLASVDPEGKCKLATLTPLCMPHRSRWIRERVFGRYQGSHI